MKKWVLLGLVGIGFLSCSSKWILDKVQQSYDEWKQIYPENFTDHFPALSAENLRYAYLKFPEGKEKRYINHPQLKRWEIQTGSKGKSFIHILVSLPNDSIEKIRNEAESGALKKYTCTNSCLLIPGKNYGWNTVQEGNAGLDGNTLEGLLLPDITCLEGYPLSSNYRETALVYVLEAEKGIYTGQFGKEEKYIPSDWQHGYSKGIIFADNYIDYWCIVW